MVTRIAGLVLAALLVFSGFCYADALIAKEAVNYYNDAVKAQKAANYELAEMNFNKAILVDPNNIKWQRAFLNNKGIILAKSGDFDSAETMFDQVLAIDPGYAVAKYNLGLVYEKRRSRLESLEYWAKVFELDKAIPKNFVTEQVEEKQ